MQASVWILWDLVALAVLIRYTAKGASHGFLRTVVSFAGFLIAFLVARAISGRGALFLYENVVRDAISLVLTRRIGDLLAGGDAPLGEIADALPATLQRILGGDALEQAASPEAGGFIETLTDAVLRDPVTSIVQWILFLLLFLLVIFGVRMLSRFLGGVNQIPLVGTVNAVVGGVFGVLQALLMLYVFALILRLIIGLSGGGVSWLNAQVMEETYIWRVFYKMV